MTTPIQTRKRLSLQSEGVVTSPYFTTTTTATTTSSPKTTTKKLKREEPIKIEYEENENEDEEEQKEEISENVNKKESLARIEWEKVWDLISVMRSKELAPVDTMGAESFNVEEIKPNEKRFHILVGCLLSSQTKDQITHAAVNRLKQHGLTVDNIIKTSQEDLEKLIHPVGFYRRKAVYLKSIAEILKSKYKSDIPPTKKEIEALPGVGPKMANLIVLIGWGRCEGIAVDVHMHRICNRLGWTNTKTPEETMKSLEKFLPKDRWSKVNLLLVGFGQTICKPVNPKCNVCTVNNLCPTGIKELKSNNNSNDDKPKTTKSKKK